MNNPPLIPFPQKLVLTPEHEFLWPQINTFSSLDPFLDPIKDSLPTFFKQLENLTKKPWGLLTNAEQSKKQIHPIHNIYHDSNLPPQAYQLRLEDKGISIICRDASGAYYAFQSLIQLARIYPSTYPQLEILDAPAVLNRGYMLDISRNKVPTIESLKSLINQLASLKYNQLQLYTEHTFAFSKHKIVWEDASPLTPEDILDLDQYAKAHFIELVPNLNTFAHLERWLRHPAYHHLAECPNGWQRPDGYGMPWGATLNPSPESESFIQSLIDEFLPLFSSDQCNIGGDEPWELGTGRSRDRCNQMGKDTVYIEFLNRIARSAGAHKKKVQFWADIILENPTHITDLAPNLTGMVWGYEANHPFAHQCKTMEQSEIPFYLVPGTSSWNSLGTRLTTALTNIQTAASLATKHNASGLLLTDWGDYGHHQPASLSALPIYVAAQHFWNPNKNLPSLVPEISLHLCHSLDFSFVQALFRLGRINEFFAAQPPNRSPLVALLLTHDGRIHEALDTISLHELVSIESELQAIRSTITTAPINAPDGELFRAEIILSVEFLLWATDRGILAIRNHQKSLSQQQRNELTELIIRFETLWLERNRPGGLDESTQRFKRLLLPFVQPVPNAPFWPPPLER